MPRFLKNKWLWIGVLLIIVLVVGFVVMSNADKAKKAEVEKASAEAVVSPYSAVANGKADVEGGIINVAARRGGVVREVLVQEGDRVTAGQVLARQEDDEPRLAVSRARAEVAQAESQLRMIQVQINTAVRERERLEKLVATNFVAAQRIDTAQDAIDTARANYASQQATIQTARARMNEAAYNLELTIIRAPMAGRIVRRYANPGAGASTLNVSNMFDLQPDTQRIVRAEIIETDIPNVQPGQDVEIVSEADQSKVYVGKVIRIAPLFGARRLSSEDQSQATDERVVEVVVSADTAPLLIGQRVLVKFMKAGQRAGAPRPVSPGVGPERSMQPAA